MQLVAGLPEALVHQQDGSVVVPVPQAPPNGLVQGSALTYIICDCCKSKGLHPHCIKEGLHVWLCGQAIFIICPDMSWQLLIGSLKTGRHDLSTAAKGLIEI